MITLYHMIVRLSRVKGRGFLKKCNIFFEGYHNLILGGVEGGESPRCQSFDYEPINEKPT